MPRLTKVQGFVVYDIFEGMVYQRSKMLGKDNNFLRNAFVEYGIDCVIGLAPGKIDPNLQEMHEDRFIDYRFYPIPDGKLTDEQLNELQTIAEEVADDLDDGTYDAVLCHCNGGRNRSGLMSALILRELIGATGKEALEIVRHERPNAIATPFFEEYLLGLD